MDINSLMLEPKCLRRVSWSVHQLYVNVTCVYDSVRCVAQVFGVG